MSDQQSNNISERTKKFHNKRMNLSPEEKYLILIELQKLALEMRKSKNLPIKAHEKVWPVQF